MNWKPGSGLRVLGIYSSTITKFIRHRVVEGFTLGPKCRSYMTHPKSNQRNRGCHRQPFHGNKSYEIAHGSESGGMGGSRGNIYILFSEIRTTLFKSNHPLMAGLSEFPSSKGHSRLEQYTNGLRLRDVPTQYRTGILLRSAHQSPAIMTLGTT
jgi:hypothetical protein